MDITALLAEGPVKVAVFMGLVTLAVLVYCGILHAGSGLKAKQQKYAGKSPLIVTFFSDPRKDSANKKGGAAVVAQPEFKKMMLVAKHQDTHDTIVLRFALPHHGRCAAAAAASSSPAVRSSAARNPPMEVAGIAPARHVQLRATINGEVVQRSFSPTSCAVDEAHCGLMDLHVKVYRPDPSRGLAGGVMSCYLDNLAIGSTVEMRGPTGIVEYVGNGGFIAGAGGNAARKVVAGKHIVFIAGGSGITPIVATMKAILHGKLGGRAVPTVETIAAAASVSAAGSRAPSAASCCDAAKEGATKEGAASSNDGDNTKKSHQREFLNGECHHSFYTPSPANLDESTNAIERITFIYANTTVDDVMFSQWLTGDDAEHSCGGAFAALAAAGGVRSSEVGGIDSVSKPIDVSMNFFVTRPSAADVKAMAEANARWEAEEREQWGLSASSASSTSFNGVPLSSPSRSGAIVTRRFVAGRPTDAAFHSCMVHGGDALATSDVRARFAADIQTALGAESSSPVSDSNTVALLCGPSGLLSEVARPALLAAGVPKDRILLA